MLKLDSEATVIIKMLMRSCAQEKNWKSRETGKGSFVGFTGLIWLNFQLCRLWLCGFGPLEFEQCTTAQLNPKWDIYIYIYFNGCLDWWVMTLDSLGPCVTCSRQLALAGTEARLASSYWYFWWFFVFFAWWYFWWIK